MKEALIGRIYSHFSGHGSSPATRILTVLVLAVLVHVVVKVIRHISEWLNFKSRAKKNPFGFVGEQPKFMTLTRLIVSGATFIIYFLAVGLVLKEFGVDLKTYLASATVIGLAISFGSQGLVQDIVTSLTLIFWDAMDVGDMVEIVGSATVIGRVEEIGLRFTKLINFYNQQVFVPNRTIANVSRFPDGGIDAYADVNVPSGIDQQKAVEIVENVAKGMWMQFGGIILSEPSIGEVQTAPGGGWDFFRAHFKIWPGQGSLIENTFRQQVIKAMKQCDPNYADWQVPVTYRANTVSKKVGPKSVTSP